MAYYKLLINENKKMSNLEFSRYVKQIVRRISTTNIVVRYTFQSDDFKRYTGAIIKYI